MQHPSVWTSLASPFRLILQQRFPEHAASAREFVKARPDCAKLKFKWFSVANLTGGAIYSVDIHLESTERMLLIKVRDDGAGLVAQAIIDRAKNQWER
ncbi:MAG: hypothetical protein EXS05_23045 [Planctomycetaceae bacterium]|nr:hypothetical protein [Planctomycetaceae bacterium]